MKDYGIYLIDLDNGHDPPKPRKLVCPICGREFETNAPNRKYCGTDCAKIAQARRKKHWLDNNYEYNKMRQREYQRKYRREGGEVYKEHRRKYYQSHKEEFRAYAKKYYQEHHDEMKEYARLYKRNHYGVVAKCKAKHNNCFSCPTKDGKCLYE